MMRLDFWIFGNGRGLAMPSMDGKLYWLVNRNTKRGEFYHWNGWFGSQIKSFQWTRPLAGEERILCGRRFRAMHSRRCWMRVCVAWAMNLPDDIDKANIELRLLQKQLGEWVP